MKLASTRSNRGDVRSLARMLAAGLSAIACAHVGGVGPLPPTAPASPASVVASQQYRLVPLTEKTRAAGDFGDDALRLQNGVRILDQPGKSPVLADTIAIAPLEGGRRLPDFVGGGFLFWSDDALFRADTFLGALRPLAAASRVERVAVGPGYLIVFADGGRLILDPKTGAAANPRQPDIVDVAAAGDGRVVTALEFGRLAVSVDNNATLREVQGELGGTAVSLSEEPLGFVLESGALMTLDAHAGLTKSAPQQPASTESGPAWPLLESPLEVAVTGGVLRAPGRAWVAASAALAEVELATGRLLSVGPQLLPGNPGCSLLEHGQELLMRCASDLKVTLLSQLETGLPRIEQVFGAGVVLNDGFGQLFADVACDEQTLPQSVCVRQAGGTWKTISGYAGGVTPHNVLGYGPKAAGGIVAFVDDSKFPEVEPSKQGYIDLATGELTPFGGMRTFQRDVAFGRCRVERSGEVRCLTREGPLSFARGGGLKPSPFHFKQVEGAGDKLLARDEQGGLFQSSDWGGSWTEVLGPPIAASLVGELEGCSPVGCKLGDWLRVGWEVHPAVRVTPPHVVPAVWPAKPSLPQLRCEARGAMSNAPSELAKYDTLPPPPAPRRFRAAIAVTPNELGEPTGRGVRGVVSGYQTTDEGDKPPSVPFAFSFLDYFDPAARAQHASSSPADIVRAARIAGSSPTSEDPRFVVGVPVLGSKAFQTAGLLVAVDSAALWLRGGRAAALPLPMPDGAIVSALATPGGDLLALLPSGSVLRTSSQSVGKAFEVPPNLASAAGGDADALGLAENGEVAVLRFGGLSEAPSAERPLLAYRPGQAPLALAAWSSILPASDPRCATTDGFRTIIQSRRSWLELVQADTAFDDRQNMSALVRWSTKQVCLEAVELAADFVVVGNDALPTRVVASFGSKPAAARLGSVQGTQLLQTLSCVLR